MLSADEGGAALMLPVLSGVVAKAAHPRPMARRIFLVFTCPDDIFGSNWQFVVSTFEVI